MMRNHSLNLLLLFLLIIFPSSISSAPAKSGDDDDDKVLDEEVKQLDALRNEHGKTDEVTNKESVLVTAVPDEVSDSSNTETSSADPKADSRNVIFRHRGITESKKNQPNWEEQKQQRNYAKYSGIQYSPENLAEYVFRTGDEEGVALAVEELVREGMMGRTDAINYLQDVKEALAYIKVQYEEARRIEEMKNRAFPRPRINQQRVHNSPRDQFVLTMDSEKKSKIPFQEPRPSTTSKPVNEESLSTSAPESLANVVQTTAKPSTEPEEKDITNNSQEKSIKNTVTKKLKDDNSAYTERTLEEVIYQLARDMFAQSILKEDETAEDSLSRLITFLELEVENKRISREIKEKVLEIISAALYDTLHLYFENTNKVTPSHLDIGKAAQLKAKIPLSLLAVKRKSQSGQKAVPSGMKSKVTSDLIALQNANSPLANHSKRA